MNPLNPNKQDITSFRRSLSRSHQFALSKNSISQQAPQPKINETGAVA
jgi:hypothetical protein